MTLYKLLGLMYVCTYVCVYTIHRACTFSHFKAAADTKYYTPIATVDCPHVVLCTSVYMCISATYMYRPSQTELEQGSIAITYKHLAPIELN